MQLRVRRGKGSYIEEEFLAVFRLREESARSTRHFDDLIACRLRERTKDTLVGPHMGGGDEERNPIVGAAVVVQTAQHHGFAASARSRETQVGIDVDRVALLERYM